MAVVAGCRGRGLVLRQIGAYFELRAHQFGEHTPHNYRALSSSDRS